jgi:hypothetical protein
MRKTVRALGRWSSIIGAMFLALALAACSTNRLAFNHAPTLVYYWLDSYFDFDGPQSLAFKDNLVKLQAWHRQQELPQLAELLKNLQPVATQDISAEQACTLWDYLQQRLQAPVTQLTPALAQLAASLKPEQMEHIATEFKKRNQKWRAEWLELTPTERVARRAQQIVERSEQFYGRLEDGQRELIRSQVLASGYDPEMAHKEMLRRQLDSLQTLARLHDPAMAADAAQAELRALFARAAQSPDPQSRQYSEGVTRSGCAAVAAVHNGSSAAQRARLVKTLQGYEADARALMQTP